MLSAIRPQAASHTPWAQHPTLTALQPSLQISSDCWALLAAPDGSSRKEHYLPKGERQPETAYRKRLEAARPSGFFRDALRTYAGMLSRGSWISLPSSLSSVLTDLDGRGTDLGVFLAAADLLVLRDGAVLVLVLPPEHSWPSEGDRQEALRRGDRPSLPRLQLMPRANCLNWELPVSYGLPGRIIWREPVNRPINAEPPGSEGAVAEQISALLGDADAPDRWHYRSLQLLTTGLQLAHHPVCADPQATSGWRCDEPVVTTFEGIHRLCRPAGTPPMARASGRVDTPHLGLAPDLRRHHAARRPDPFPETRCCPTEMEISLPASQSYALLQAMAIQKASFFSTLLQHWCALTGEPLDPGAGLQVTVSPLTPLILPRPQVKAWIEL